MNLALFLQSVARAYDALPMTPSQFTYTNSHLAYAQLRGELWQQYRELTSRISVHFTTHDAYPSSQEMFRQLDSEHHLDVYTGGHVPASHPFHAIAPNGERFNSIFRAVHDGIAHWPERNSFGYLGEFKAFKAHARTLTPLSVLALATETLGQNASYNFGAYPRQFPSQKTGLLPASLVHDALTLEFTE